MADLCALACLYLFSGVCQALDSSLESTFSKKDSASGEQCGSVAHYGKGTNTKFANLYHNAQSSHSPTANLRILEEKQARRELSSQADEALFPSSRASVASVAIHSLESSFEKVDSRNALFANAKSMDCHADKSARNDNKNAAFQNEDSRENAQILNNSAQDPREMVAA